MLRDELNTPAKRTKFMRTWMESTGPDSFAYFMNSRDLGYNDRQHCEEELFKYDKEVCFYFFPHLKGLEEDDFLQTGISTDYNVTVSGGGYAG